MTKNKWILFLVFGIFIFIILYFIATLFYPGGSQVDKNAIGFSWIHNYWCNLLSEKAINGSPNSSKPIAVIAMLILCISLIFFWFLFTKYVKAGILIKRTIQISGTLSMLIAFFLFSKFDHDLITNLASFFGIIAITAVLITLYKNKFYGLFLFGLFNILLVGLNNFIYYNQDYIVYLPVVQKISFATFLIWICSICLRLYQTTSSHTNLGSTI